MIPKVRSLILAGVASIGLLGSEATAHDGHDDYGPGIAVGEPYGGPDCGYDRPFYPYGHKPYRPVYTPYRPSYSSYTYTQTTVTTIVYCDRCGHRHAKGSPCGGYGGYRGYDRPYRTGYGYPRGYGYPGPYPW